MAKKSTPTKEKEGVAIQFKMFYIRCDSDYAASKFLEELDKLCNEYAVSPDDVVYRYECE